MSQFLKSMAQTLIEGVETQVEPMVLALIVQAMAKHVAAQSVSDLVGGGTVHTNDSGGNGPPPPPPGGTPPK